MALRVATDWLSLVVGSGRAGAGSNSHRRLVDKAITFGHISAGRARACIRLSHPARHWRTDGRTDGLAEFPTLRYATVSSASATGWRSGELAATRTGRYVQLETSPCRWAKSTAGATSPTKYILSVHCWTVRLEQPLGPCPQPERPRSCFQEPAKDILLARC